MLVDTRGWEPEGGRAPRRRRPRAWRPFAWFAAFCWLLVIAAEVGGFAGYGIFLLAVALGSWRLERAAGHWQSGRAGDSGAWY